jgi:polyhydroxyalkanoate synthesis regulator phasin
MKEETKRKISLANKGRKFSAEWRRKLSISHKGQVSPRKGKKFVDENVSKAKRKEYRKEWTLKNRIKILEAGRNWKRKNRKRVALLARLRYQKNNQKELDRIRFNKYGITGDKFRKILKRQGAKCPICNRDIAKNPSVDHDHLTGKIRGLICNKCNLAIGNAEDSPTRLRAMADYLERNK